MQIKLNGEKKEVPPGTSVYSLLLQLGLPPGGVALAINGLVVPFSQQEKRMLEEGDTLEIIRAVGGG